MHWLILLHTVIMCVNIMDCTYTCQSDRDWHNVFARMKFLRVLILPLRYPLVLSEYEIVMVVVT